MRPLIFASLLGLVGCHASGQATDIQAQQAKLDEIADKCHVSRATFVLRDDGDLHIKPAQTEPYGKVACVLAEVRRANLPLKMGFVGNEAYVSEGDNAQTH